MVPVLYGFAYAPQALAYLKTIQPKARQLIIKHIQALAADPYPHTSRVVQGKTHGDQKVRRIRSGVYRVLYSVRRGPDEIVILDIGHRKDVYR